MPELCPKCNGQETVSIPSGVAGDIPYWTGAGTGNYTCPVCGGAGYI